MKIYKYFLFISIILASCDHDYYPKPEGFMRIDLPEHSYKLYNNPLLPVEFSISEYAIVSNLDVRKGIVKFNIEYPKMNAKIHLSYNKLENNLDRYLEETRGLTYKHQEKASDIDKRRINMSDNNVYGIKYYLSGEVASSTQFFVTDSINNFMRGALYFWSRPNEDSLATSTSYIREDLDVLIESINWK